MKKEPWFRAKRYGYGAGLPFTWQGWLFLVAHVGLLAGIGFLSQNHMNIITGILLICAAFAPLPIYKARTEGGWRWRWGQD